MYGNQDHEPGQTDLTYLYDRLNLPAETRSMIEELRGSEPLRRTRSSRKNVSSRYPSVKMKRIIQVESRTIERPAAIECEMDQQTLEYWDQAVRLSIPCEADGRSRTITTIMDFIQIRSDGIILLDCKSTGELARKAAERPDQYAQDDTGRWYSPCGDRIARKLGVSYRVFCEHDVNAIYINNMDFLADFFRSPPTETIKSEASCLIERIADKRILRLSDILADSDNPDAVYWLIAANDVFVDLRRESLLRPEEVHVCAEPDLCNVITATDNVDARPPRLTNLRVNSTFTWSGSRWNVVNIGNDGYFVSNHEGNLQILSPAIIASEVRDGRLQIDVADTSTESCALTELKSASAEDIRVAVNRKNLIDARETGKDLGERPARRTIDRWRARFQAAQEKHGNGIVGLLPNRAKMGNRSPKVRPEQARLVEQSLRDDYEVPTRPTIKAAYHRYLLRSEDQSVAPVAYATYTRWAKTRDKRDTIEKQEGFRASVQAAPEWLLATIDIDEEMPAHGNRAWEVAHVDHTQWDQDLISEWGGKVLGRPYLTILYDGYSGHPLAHVLTYNPPSRPTLMILLRECVKRWGQLPRRIVTDLGAEFGSEYWEFFLASYGIEKVDRPAGQPRFGAMIERSFRTTMTQFIYTLSGNNQNRKPGRKGSKSHDPSRFAVWTPSEVAQRLEQYLFHVAPDLPHMGQYETPRERFERSRAESGPRDGMYIPYDAAFYFQTLIPVQGRTRRIKRGSVRANNAIYSSSVLRALQYDGRTVDVRYDPFDVGRVYAYVDNHWEELTACDHHTREVVRRKIPYAHIEICGRARTSQREYSYPTKGLRDLVSDIAEYEKSHDGQSSESNPTGFAPPDRGGDHVTPVATQLAPPTIKSIASKGRT